LLFNNLKGGEKVIVLMGQWAQFNIFINLKQKQEGEKDEKDCFVAHICLRVSVPVIGKHLCGTSSRRCSLNLSRRYI
jgi:hypothetical protein